MAKRGRPPKEETLIPCPSRVPEKMHEEIKEYAKHHQITKCAAMRELARAGLDYFKEQKGK